VDAAAIIPPAPVLIEMYTSPVGVPVLTFRAELVSVIAWANEDTTDTSMSPRIVETLTMCGGKFFPEYEPPGASELDGAPTNTGPRSRV